MYTCNRFRPQKVLSALAATDGAAWLLLPALSPISSRGEWQPFRGAVLQTHHAHQDFGQELAALLS